MRLTKEIKTQIVSAALNVADIPAKESALEQARFNWAEAVRVDSLGGKDACAKVQGANDAIQALLSELPKGVVIGGTGIRYYHKIYVNVAGCSVYANFEKSSIAPSSHTLLAGSQLAEEFWALENTQKELMAARNNLEMSVKSILDSVNTDAQLIKVWPESAPLIPKPVKTDRNLPTVMVSELNKLLGVGK